MPNKSKPRVVIDTNLIISSAIVSSSPPHKLIKAWVKGEFTLLTSKEQLREIKEVSDRKKLRRYHLLPAKITELLENMEFAAELVDNESFANLKIHTRDPKDDYLLAVAIFGKADYLISGDKDFLALNDNPYTGNLKVVKASEFLDLLDN